jgi:hypothetical protein
MSDDRTTATTRARGGAGCFEDFWWSKVRLFTSRVAGEEVWCVRVRCGERFDLSASSASFQSLSLRRFTASGLPWIHLISISTPGGLAGPANPLLPTRFHAKLSLASAKLKFTGRSRKATKGMMGGGAELRH